MPALSAQAGIATAVGTAVDPVAFITRVFAACVARLDRARGVTAQVGQEIVPVVVIVPPLIGPVVAMLDTVPVDVPQAPEASTTTPAVPLDCRHLPPVIVLAASIVAVVFGRVKVTGLAFVPGVIVVPLV